MTSKRVLPGALLLIGGLGALTGCCHRQPGAGVAVSVAPDSLAGVVAIVGTTFEQRIVLRPSESTVALAAASAVDSAALSRIGGAEIMVRGRSEAGTFRVTGFTVVRVAGSPVVDGVITRDGDHLVLATATRRIQLANPPAAFQGMIGARVWVGGPLDTGPNTYGVIRPAP